MKTELLLQLGRFWNPDRGMHSRGLAGKIPCVQIFEAASDVGKNGGPRELEVLLCSASSLVEMRPRSRTHHHRKSWWVFLLSLVVSHIFGFSGRWSSLNIKINKKPGWQRLAQDPLQFVLFFFHYLSVAQKFASDWWRMSVAVKRCYSEIRKDALERRSKRIS